jgi:hypothetical protein
LKNSITFFFGPRQPHSSSFSEEFTTQDKSYIKPAIVCGYASGGKRQTDYANFHKGDNTSVNLKVTLIIHWHVSTTLCIHQFTPLYEYNLKQLMHVTVDYNHATDQAVSH